MDRETVQAQMKSVGAGGQRRCYSDYAVAVEHNGGWPVGVQKAGAQAEQITLRIRK